MQRKKSARQRAIKRNAAAASAAVESSRGTGSLRGTKAFGGRWVYDQRRSESMKPIINALGMSEIAQLAADKIQIYYNIFDTEGTWSVEVRGKILKRRGKSC